MNSEIKHSQLLKILVIASVISTLIHNVDNYLRFDLYPQPSWITLGGIPRSWILWTIVGVIGYFLYKNRRFWLSYLCLIIYSFCGLSSLGHYLYGSKDEFSFFMHVFILTDGLTGSAILAFTLRSALFRKAHFRNSLSNVWFTVASSTRKNKD